MASIESFEFFLCAKIRKDLIHLKTDSRMQLMVIFVLLSSVMHGTMLIFTWSFSSFGSSFSVEVKEKKDQTSELTII